MPKPRKIAKDTTPWSDQQVDIHNWFTFDHPLSARNLIIRARAGTGKSTTITRGVYISPNDSIRMMAFGRRAAQELQDKLAKKRYGGSGRISATTLNAYGHHFFYANNDCAEIGFKKVVKVDNFRDRRFLEQYGQLHGFPFTNKSLARPMLELIAKAKQMAPFVGTDKAVVKADIETLVGLMGRFGCAPPPNWVKEGFDLETAARSAMTVMDMTVKEQDGSCSNDDQIFLPLRRGWVKPVHDLVVIDEAQDMNTAQLEMSVRIAAGRIAVVGDDRQAIYKFRGADTEALDRMKVRLDAIEMPLTVTRRCAKQVVAVAQQFVPDFEAADEAPDGDVLEGVELDEMYERVQPGDYIISRTNAPLVSIAFTLLREGRRIRILGRDGFKQQFVRLVDRMKASSIGDLRQRLQKWNDDELNQLKAQGADDRDAQRQEDKFDFIMSITEGQGSVSDVLKTLDSLLVDDEDAADPNSYITCTSVHQAKGLEAERVFVLETTLFLPKGDAQEEENIAYVAYTRAKRELQLVQMPRKKNG